MTAALEGGEWSAARPCRILPLGKTRYPFYRRLGGPQGQSGRAENLVPTGIRSQTHLAHSQSLYWLSYRAHDVQKVPCINIRQTCSTIIKLAVLLLTVHNVERVRNISFHVAHFKIKPLMMMGRVNIRHQDEVILIWWHLKYTLKDCNILALLDTSNERCGTQCRRWNLTAWPYSNNSSHTLTTLVNFLSSWFRAS